MHQLGQSHTLITCFNVPSSLLSSLFVATNSQHCFTKLGTLLAIQGLLLSDFTASSVFSCCSAGTASANKVSNFFLVPSFMKFRQLLRILLISALVTKTATLILCKFFEETE